MRPVGLLPEDADLALVRVRQRIEQHPSRDAVDRRGPADAESEREDREQRIAWPRA